MATEHDEAKGHIERLTEELQAGPMMFDLLLVLEHGFGVDQEWDCTCHVCQMVCMIMSDLDW